MAGKTSTLTIYITPPKGIYNSRYNVTKSNVKHQFDLNYLLHNVFEGKIYKWVFTCVDAASRYKVDATFRSKKLSEVAFLLKAIYNFIMIKGAKLRVMWHSSLKTTLQIFEKQKFQAYPHNLCR